MPVLEKIVNFGKLEKIADTKTFNNMSPEEGFEWAYPQYNSAVYMLEACYDLLEEAGFKNIAKDTEAQSLDVWGLKLFFVNTYNSAVGANVCEAGCAINIAAPGVKHPYYASNDATSRSDGHIYNYASMLCNKVIYNYFLQSSVVDLAGFASNTTSAYWVGNGIWQEYRYKTACSTGYHASVKINKTNDVYSFAVTLRCSNDNIVFTVQRIDNVYNTRSVEYPLFSIFKGKDIVNDKEILVLGKTLERAPFFFSNNNTNSYWNTHCCYNYKAAAAEGHGNRLSDSTSYPCIYPLYSTLICSGSNIIYHTDDLYTPLSDTLYLDYKMNVNGANAVIEKGNAYGNHGKYMLYGVNEIINYIPVTQGKYYDLDSEKYWCKNNILTTPYGCNFDVPYNNFKHANYGTNLYSNTFDMLNHNYNLFGYGAVDTVNTNPTCSMRDKQTTPDLLNPAILIRIDDEITEE